MSKFIQTTFYLFIKFFMLIFADIGNDDANGKNQQKVLLISLDGFRWDYLNRILELLPNGFFSTLIKRGAIYNKDGMLTTFATATFPNHWSLVTGLYQENHGIIANKIFDPTTKLVYDLKNDNQDSSCLHGGEPIWRTIKRNRPREAANSVGCYMWIGCRYGRLGARNFVRFRRNHQLDESINPIVQWFRKGASLVLLYVSDVDEAGHSCGPDSVQLNQTLIDLDVHMYQLYNKLKNHCRNLNLILVSDHGMTTIKDQLVINENLDLFSIGTNGGVFWHIFPKDDNSSSELTYQYFKNIEKRYPNKLRVFWKHEIPEHWHYKNNRRIGEILVVAEPGYILAKNKPRYPMSNKGIHGYTTDSKDMRGLFLAYGPAFLTNDRMTRYSHVTSIDIYLLMCKILRLTPAPNNGSDERVLEILDVSRIY